MHIYLNRLFIHNNYSNNKLIKLFIKLIITIIFLIYFDNQVNYYYR